MMRRKVGIIGAGHVGSHVAAGLALLNICEDIVLIDTDRRKAEAHGADLQDMVCYGGRSCRIWAGGYEDISDAQVCVISASGEIFKENRLEELDVALDVMDDIIPKLKASGFGGILVSITNPCDLVALYLHMKTDYPVIGTGTALDSARFRIRIARELDVRPDSVEAFCIGNTGTARFPSGPRSGSAAGSWMSWQRRSRRDGPWTGRRWKRALWRPAGRSPIRKEARSLESARRRQS